MLIYFARKHSDNYVAQVEAKEPSKKKPKAAAEEVATEAACECDEKESQYLWNFSPA